MMDNREEIKGNLKERTEKGEGEGDADKVKGTKVEERQRKIS